MNKWINGIPPVGEECEYVDVEYRGKTQEWLDLNIGVNTGIFIAKYKGEFVLAHKDMSGAVVACEVRPLQTKDTEREEAINEIVRTVSDERCRDDWCDRTVAEAVYDAGFRKINPISDEDIEGRISSMIVSNDSYVRGIRTGIKWAINKMLNKKQ